MERVQGCLERDTDASPTAHSSSCGGGWWFACVDGKGDVHLHSHPSPPPPHPCSDLFLDLGQKQIPVMAFNTCVAFLPTAPPPTPPCCSLSRHTALRGARQTLPSAWKLSPPRPAEAPHFIASNFTFFCLSLTWPRPLMSFPSPSQLVRIPPRWLERDSRAPAAGVSAPALLSCLWCQEWPRQGSWGLSEKGACCGLGGAWFSVWPPPCDLGRPSFLSRGSLQVGLGCLPAAPSSIWTLALRSHQEARCWLSLASASHPSSLLWVSRGV